MEKNIIAYDKKADNYESTLDGKFTERLKCMLLDFITVKDGDNVLDIGCGNGSLLSRMVEKSKGFGTDISPQMIKNAAERCPQMQFEVADCNKIPFDDRMMDVITVCAAYHHFPDVNAFATEVKRLLKTGGSIYIAEIYLPPIIRQIANIFLPLSKDGDVKFYSFKEIVGVFNSFDLVKAKQKGCVQIIHLRLSNNKL